MSPTLIRKCPRKPPISERPLLTVEQANDLGEVFWILSNDTRLRLLHALVRDQELRVNELAAAVEMKPQAVSNQLQRLADRGIVRTRRNGTAMYYRIVDPCVVSLLEHGICLAEDSRNLE